MPLPMGDTPDFVGFWAKETAILLLLLYKISAGNFFWSVKTQSLTMVVVFRSGEVGDGSLSTLRCWKGLVRL